jgi:hypothetical protein
MTEKLGGGYVELGADTTKLDKGVDDAARVTQKLEQRIEKAFAKMADAPKRAQAEMDVWAKTVEKGGGVASLAAAQVEQLARKLQYLQKAGAEVPPALRNLPGMTQPLGLLGKAAKDARADVEQGMRGVASSLGPVGAGLTALGPAGLIAAGAISIVTVEMKALEAVISTLVEWTKGALEYSDNLVETAGQIGFSTDALQEWNFAASQAGAAEGTVSTSAIKLSRALADGSKETRAAIDDLGLSIDELRQYNPEQQFEVITRALAGIADPGLRAAIAADLGLGKNLDYLKLLASNFDEARGAAESFGAKLSGEALASTAEMRDALDRLDGAWAGFKIGIVAAITTSPEAKRALDDVAQAIGQVTAKVLEALPTLVKFVDLHVRMARGAVEAAKAAASGPVGMFAAYVKGSSPGPASTAPEPPSPGRQPGPRRDAEADREATRAAKELARTREAAAEKQKKAEEDLARLIERARTASRISAEKGIQEIVDGFDAARAAHQRYLDKIAQADAKARKDEEEADAKARKEEEEAEAQAEAKIVQAEEERQARTQAWIDNLQEASRVLSQIAGQLEGQSAQLAEAASSAAGLAVSIQSGDIAGAVGQMSGLAASLNEAFFSEPERWETVGADLGRLLGQAVSDEFAKTVSEAMDEEVDKLKADLLTQMGQDEGGFFEGVAEKLARAIADQSGLTDKTFLSLLPEWAEEQGVALSSLTEEMDDFFLTVFDGSADARASMDALLEGVIGELGEGVPSAVGALGDITDHTLSLMASGLLESYQGTATLGDAFAALGQAAEDGTAGAHEQMLELIQSAREAGLEVAEIAKAVAQSLTEGIGSLGKMPPIVTQDDAQAQAELFATTWDAAVQELGIFDAAKQFAPQWEALQKQLGESGFDVSGILGSGISEIMGAYTDEKLGPVLQGAEAVSNLMASLDESGFMTSGALASGEQQAQSIYDRLLAGGMSEESAQQAIGPLLAQLQQAAEDYDLTLSEGTQKLIENADISMKEDKLGSVADATAASRDALWQLVELNGGVVPALESMKAAMDAVGAPGASGPSGALQSAAAAMTFLEVPKLGGGGHVTAPMLAIVGDVPETIVPDSVQGALGAQVTLNVSAPVLQFQGPVSKDAESWILGVVNEAWRNNTEQMVSAAAAALKGSR